MGHIGGIEAGGTKFICATGDGETGRIFSRRAVPTEGPTSTLQTVTAWFLDRQRAEGRLEAIGIASFGPIDLDRDSATFGRITSTPKKGWKNVDIVGAVSRAFPGVPIGFDTDVNGAALAEQRWGAARGLSDFLYVTIGTGIGGGGLMNGRLMHGLLHPEIGHMRLPREPGDDGIGVCPFHADCWEGLCCGPAMEKRYGYPAAELPADHPGWELQTRYVASALANLVCVCSPRSIVIGGSVRKGGRLGQEAFFERVRQRLQQVLNHYIAAPLLEEQIHHYVVPPALDDDAGVCGALALGQLALAARGSD